MVMRVRVTMVMMIPQMTMSKISFRVQSGVRFHVVVMVNRILHPLATIKEDWLEMPIPTTAKYIGIPAITQIVVKVSALLVAICWFRGCPYRSADSSRELERRVHERDNLSIGQVS